MNTDEHGSERSRGCFVRLLLICYRTLSVLSVEVCGYSIHCFSGAQTPTYSIVSRVRAETVPRGCFQDVHARMCTTRTEARRWRQMAVLLREYSVQVVGPD